MCEHVFYRRSRSSLLSAGREKRDKVGTDVLATGRPDQQRTYLLIVRGHEGGAFQAVSVKNPTSHEQRGALISFSEGLRSGYPEGQYGRSLDRIFDPFDGCQSTGHPVEFIGFVEPLVITTYNVVDRHHEADSRPIQWSCR